MSNTVFTPVTSSIQDKDLSTPAQSGFAPILVLYTTMMMKQYHLKHFYVN